MDHQVEDLVASRLISAVLRQHTPCGRWRFIGITSRMPDADDAAIGEMPSLPQRDRGDRNRRTRIAPTVDPEVRAWLRRIAASHAHLCYIVRLFGRPDTAGGQSLEGEAYAARAARGDRTLLFDALGYVGDEIADIRHDIARRMESAPATAAAPGTADKVRVMCERAAHGFDLFIAGDAAIDVN